MAHTPDDKTILSEGRVLGPYKLLKQIGAGGMGVVFQARDIERNTLVALKTLHKLDPLALLKLKNEFRSTANVLHPNLVMLHELMREEDVWFFTMEYVEGESLATRLKRAADTSRQDSPLVSMETVTSARADSPLTPPDTETRTSLRSGAFADTLPASQASKTHEETLTSMSKPDTNVLTTSPSPATEAQAALASQEAPVETRPLLELEELRHVFSELALGICALHEAGKLHCDIKPGNVMVAEDGRVVLLDFGLVTERVQDKSRGDAVLAGTPAYMAPEQVAGEPASEASDWYALGVMLYESLCGRRPFGSDSAFREKLQRTAPPLPASAHIPEDLRELCMALLNREPAARPSGREVLERLRGERAQLTPSEPAQEVRALLGRQEHLAVLGQAYQTVRTGSAVTLHVHGRSGMGKTTLLQRFLGELRHQEGVVVLHGRCYERESVPYKAFDELVDSLTRYLQSLPSRELREL
ncbi:MAG TPA: serine/threonine-protein kinase, partial [Archangium sp.]|nr:serine/threonine-protein kinase [Archangium sp.]